MTRKRWALFLTVLLVFVAGTWMFTVLWPASNESGAELEFVADQDLIQAAVLPPLPEAGAEGAGSAPMPETLDFTQVSEPGVAAALPERTFLPQGDMPSQLNKIEGIASVAPRLETEEDALTQTPKKEDSPVYLGMDISDKKGGLLPEDISLRRQQPGEPTSIAPIAVPVKWVLIRSVAEYKKFKERAKGSYPQVDFNKEMLVVLESDSNLPDKVFEIRSAQVKGGKLHVEYAVNVFGLDKKINSHSVKAVKKTQATVELSQVL